MHVADMQLGVMICHAWYISLSDPVLQWNETKLEQTNYHQTDAKELTAQALVPSADHPSASFLQHVMPMDLS